MRILVLFTTLLSFFMSGQLIPQKVSFPRTKSSTDPSKRYSVIWKEATDSTEHILLLKNLKTGYTRPLTKFARHVDFFWAPDGNAFAVTDAGGSNFSTAWVGFPLDSSRTISLDMDSPESKENDHVYFEVTRWRNSATLLFKVRGYGEHDPKGFEKYFEYTLNGKISEIKHRQNK